MERREHTRQRDPVKAPSTAGAPATRAGSALFFAAYVVLASVGCGGSSGTIGALLGQRPSGRLFVREVPPGLASARAGVRAGDEILLIDGKDARGMAERDLHRALEGEVGDSLKLTLVRGSEIVRVTLTLTPAVRFPLERRNPQ